MKHRNIVKILIAFAFAAASLGCDRVTKELARTHLKDRPSVSFFHDAFRLDYAENTGAFLSMGSDWSASLSFWVLSFLPLLFLVALLVYTLRKALNERFVQVMPFLLIVSGGLGNVLDRILYSRHVTDFMNAGIGGLRTGIFNFADVYVTAGVIMLLFMAGKNRSNADAHAQKPVG